MAALDDFGERRVPHRGLPEAGPTFSKTQFKESRMSNPTPHDGTAAQPPEQPPVRRVFQLLPAAIALLAAIGIILLIVTGQTEHVSAVAAFGGAVFLGDAAANVTINVIRR